MVETIPLVRILDAYRSRENLVYLKEEDMVKLNAALIHSLAIGEV